MFDLATATKATERDFGAILDHLDRMDVDGWNHPVRCDGWTVRSLARHLVAASRGQGDGLRRAAAGQSDIATLDLPLATEPTEIREALHQGRDELLLALTGLPESAAFVPLPFGLLPTPVACQIVALEYGFHRNDLEWALGDEAPLAADISDSLLGTAPGLLPMMAGGSPVSAAGQAPADALSYHLSAPGFGLLASFDGAAWTIAPAADAPADACRITGDRSAVSMFVMGRIAAVDPRPQVSDTRTAAAFKTYFPGP